MGNPANETSKFVKDWLGEYSKDKLKQAGFGLFAAGVLVGIIVVMAILFFLFGKKKLYQPELAFFDGPVLRLIWKIDRSIRWIETAISKWKW